MKSINQPWTTSLPTCRLVVLGTGWTCLFPSFTLHRVGFAAQDCLKNTVFAVTVPCGFPVILEPLSFYCLKVSVMFRTPSLPAPFWFEWSILGSVSCVLSNKN